MGGDSGEHVAVNQALWDKKADEYALYARRNWAQAEIDWGIWSVPEADVRVLPAQLSGIDVVELGCGTGYISSWLARRGARPVGVDVSPRQLATARRMQDVHELRFPLVRASAERVPLADARFDLAVSEYGASLWCDPRLWVAEAGRLLRPRGRLVFLTNAALMYLCAQETNDIAIDTVLKRDYFGMRTITWPDEDGVEFHLNHGDWIRTLRSAGFDILDLIEIRAPDSASDDPRFPWVSAEWARRWPSEEIWVAEKARSIGRG
jgi:SAM-dependent methyltransferase